MVYFIPGRKLDQTHNRAQKPTRLVMGSDFIHIIKTRINALLTRSSDGSWKPQELVCRDGCLINREISLEPHIRTANTHLKPAIVVAKSGKNKIIYVQVV